MAGRDPRRWMWAEACEVLEQAERLHRQFFEVRPGPRPGWQPPVDVLETERDVTVIAALPGVPPDRVEVRFEQGVLVIAGHRPLPAEARGGAIHRLEVPHGYFQRMVDLPPGRYQVEREELRDGCLVLRLGKV